MIRIYSVYAGFAALLYHKTHFVYHFMIFGAVHAILTMNTQMLKRDNKKIIICKETTLNNSQNREDEL